MIHHDSDSSKQCKPVKQLDMLITVDLCCEPCNCSKGKQTGHMESYGAMQVEGLVVPWCQAEREKYATLMLLICTDGVAWQLTESQRFVAIYALIITYYMLLVHTGTILIYMILYANNC